jgi:hypothetical protein
MFTSCFGRNMPPSPMLLPHNETFSETPVDHEKPINKFKSEDFFVDGSKMTGLDNISKILMLITEGRTLSQTKQDLKMKRKSFENMKFGNSKLGVSVGLRRSLDSCIDPQQVGAPLTPKSTPDEPPPPDDVVSKCAATDRNRPLLAIIISPEVRDCW